MIIRHQRRRLRATTATYVWILCSSFLLQFSRSFLPRSSVVVVHHKRRIISPSLSGRREGYSHRLWAEQQIKVNGDSKGSSFEPLDAVDALARAVHNIGVEEKRSWDDDEEEEEGEYYSKKKRNELNISQQPRVFQSLLSAKKESDQGMGNGNGNAKNTKVVLKALASLERDMSMLDNLTGQESQLSLFEVSVLIGTVVAAAGSPLLPAQIAEVLAPASAALSAAIGIGAEYIGKVAGRYIIINLTDRTSIF